MNEIESNEGGRKELENIFEEAEATKEGRGLTLKELWKKEKLDFITDQRKNGNIFSVEETGMKSTVLICFDSYLHVVQ